MSEAPTEERRFPVIRGHRDPLPPVSLPWCAVEPFRARAHQNHSQSLERLAERGGMSPAELACCLRNEALPMSCLPHNKPLLDELSHQGNIWINETIEAEQKGLLPQLEHFTVSVPAHLQLVPCPHMTPPGWKAIATVCGSRNKTYTFGGAGVTEEQAKEQALQALANDGWNVQL